MDAGRLKMSTEQLAKITENIWRRKTVRWPTLNLYGIIVLSLWGARCPLICYRRPNCPVESIWGATILQDRSIWVFEVQLYCKTKLNALFNFCSKRSWRMCSNHFNKQMSFCPNHLSLVTNELWPKCSLKIFWVWISREAVTHRYALNPQSL